MWSVTPTQVVCRVDADNAIWVLVRYAGDTTRWERFANEASLQTLLTRGRISLSCPSPYISPDNHNEKMNEANARIAKLERDVKKFRSLLDKVLAKPVPSTTTSPSLPLAQALPNKVTTGSTTRARPNSLKTSTSASLLEAKLGNFPVGLQNRFVSTLSEVKRRDVVRSTSPSDCGESSSRDPSPALRRSASTVSVGTAGSGRTSAAEELKAMLRERKAAAPRPSTLDPYLTDGSEASGAQPSSSNKSGPSSRQRGEESFAPGLRHSPASGTGTAVNTPASGGSRPQLFPSDDEGSYWADSDAASYDRQRDLEGGVSTDDGGYNSEFSSARSEPSPPAAAIRSAEARKQLTRSTSGGSTGSAAPAMDASAGVVGIALKDEGSRESAASSSHGGAMGGPSPGRGSAASRLPRRSQSFESVGSTGSNSNSNGGSRSRTTKPSTSTVQQTSDGAYPFQSDDWTVASRDNSSSHPPGFGAEEDSCLSMRLSQDEDESRSMLFSHLREDSRSCSVGRGYGTAGSETSASTFAGNGSTGAAVGGLFGLVMRNVVNVANYITGSAQSTGGAAAEPGDTVPQDAAAPQGGEDDLDMRVSDDDDDASTLIEAEAEAEEMGLAPQGAAPADGSSEGNTVESAKAELSRVAQLRPDFDKATTEAREKLHVFQKAVIKAQLPIAARNILLRCLITRELPPMDAAAQLSGALCAMQVVHIAGTEVHDNAKHAKHGKKKGGDNGQAGKVEYTDLDPLAVLDTVSAVLQKLYQRNKKVVATDGLTVSTIAAAAIVHCTLLLHFFGKQPALLSMKRQAGAVVALEQCLDRLVLRLTSTLLEASTEVPWLLQYQGDSPIVHEDDDMPHIERFVHLLTAKFSGGACWAAVKDAILRYDYTYQRNLISPVKVRRPAGAVKKSSGTTAAQSSYSGSGMARDSTSLPLFDVSSSTSQSTGTALPPKSGAQPPMSLAGGASSSSSATSRSKPVALTSSTGAAPAGHQSMIAELLQKTKKRKMGLDVDDAATASGPALSDTTLSKAAGEGATAAGVARAADAGPPTKRRNILLSDRPQQPVGHRTSMGVGKRVVISAKTLAATAAASAAAAEVAAALTRQKSTTNTSSSNRGGVAGGILRGGGVAASGVGHGFDDHLTKTPRKGITFGDVQGTPAPSQRDDDYLLFTQSITASAMRHRNTTVVEGTPMEMLQPRRAASCAAYGAYQRPDSIACLRSPGSPDSRHPDLDRDRDRDRGHRRRAPSTGGSKSSSSSGGDSGRKPYGSGRHKNSLSSLFNTQDDEGEGEGESGEAGREGDEVEEECVNGDYSLLARARSQTRKSLLSAEGFHYLPPGAGRDEDEL